MMAVVHWKHPPRLYDVGLPAISEIGTGQIAYGLKGGSYAASQLLV